MASVSTISLESGFTWGRVSPKLESGVWSMEGRNSGVLGLYARIPMVHLPQLTLNAGPRVALRGTRWIDNDPNPNWTFTQIGFYLGATQRIWQTRLGGFVLEGGISPNLIHSLHWTGEGSTRADEITRVWIWEHEWSARFQSGRFSLGPYLGWSMGSATAPIHLSWRLTGIELRWTLQRGR